MSSFWRNFNHWLHRKLSKWQLSVQSVIKISSKWQHFRFSVSVHKLTWKWHHVFLLEEWKFCQNDNISIWVIDSFILWMYLCKLYMNYPLSWTECPYSMTPSGVPGGYWPCQWFTLFIRASHNSPLLRSGLDINPSLVRTELSWLNKVSMMFADAPFLASPGHQQLWFWLCRLGRSLSYMRKDFNYLCHVSVEEW